MTNENMTDYIAIIDSGIGGLAILKELRKSLPNEKYIYYADKKYFPYGNKGRQFLIKRLLAICDYLIKTYSIKLIILACNTATTTCLETLKKIYGCKIIGLEPFTIANDYKNSIIIASKRTKKNCINNNSKIISMPKLINIIEKDFNDNNKIIFELNSSLKDYMNGKFENIILGCTHYNLIKNIFMKILPNINVVDYSKQLVDIAIKYLFENDIENNSQSFNQTIFISSDKSNKYIEYMKIIEGD